MRNEEGKLMLAEEKYSRERLQGGTNTFMEEVSSRRKGADRLKPQIMM